MSNIRKKQSVDQLHAYRHVHTSAQLPKESFITIPDVLMWVLGACALFAVITFARGFVDFFTPSEHYMPAQVAAEPEYSGDIEVSSSPMVDRIGTVASQAASDLNHTITGLQKHFTNSVGLKSRPKKPVGNAFNE